MSQSSLCEGKGLWKERGGPAIAVLKVRFRNAGRRREEGEVIIVIDVVVVR